MCYKHILVAVDLSEDSKYLVDKAVSLAKSMDAKISFIHIDVNYAELYTGLVDINLIDTQNHSIELAQEELNRLADYANYPIEHTLVGNGDLSNEICETIGKYHFDLVVCGHHQDFWSKLLSSTKLLLNNTPIEVLVVPLKE